MRLPKAPALRPHHRLATQLVALVVLVTLLTGGAAGALVVDRARQAMRDEILLSGLAAADLAAGVAAGYMDAAQGDARDLAASSDLRNAATQGDLALATPELERWLYAHPHMLGVGLSDLTGVTRATGLADKSIVGVQTNTDLDWFQGVLLVGQPFMGAPGLSAVTNLPRVPYGVPVRDGTGAVRAVLIASISVQQLSDTLTAVKLGPNARTNLNDVAHSVILANVDRGRILQPSSGKSATNEATTRMEAGQRGAMENVNSSNQHTLAAFTPVPGLPWAVLIQQPSEDAFAPVDDMIHQVIVLIAVAVALAACVGTVLALGITRPIRQLRNALEAMAGGDLRQRVGTTRPDELGELGRGFDRMADELQQTLTDLQDGEARFKGLISVAFDGFAIHQDGRILEASEGFAKLFGYQRADLVGRSVVDLADAESHEFILNRILAGAKEPYEGVGLKKDGERFPMELVDNACRYEGRPARTIAVRDVTPRKTAEHQAKSLAKAEKLRALGQMATGIAHDLNQSLMLVASYSDLARRALDRKPADLDELRDLFTTATQAALDGGEAVKRLLVFTRQPTEPEGQPVDITTLVHEVAQMTAPRWRDTTQVEGRPIALDVEAVGDPMILGSAARLREALMNLVFNAVDALPNGGTIRMTVEVTQDRAIIRVIDTGVGMNPEVQARIFEPFYTTKGGSGTGLGLSMVFGIVEQHGGAVRVQSVPGEGTTFELAFPLLESALAVAVTQPAQAVLHSVGALRVLTVDDEPAMTRAVVRMLRATGHVVSVSGSGEEALELMATETFDVVISDMGMGSGMNGWDLAAAVKHRWPNVRFLLATGWGAAIDPAEAHARGVEAVLAKPYRPIDLELALARQVTSESATLSLPAA